MVIVWRCSFENEISFLFSKIFCFNYRCFTVNHKNLRYWKKMFCFFFVTKGCDLKLTNLLYHSLMLKPVQKWSINIIIIYFTLMMHFSYEKHVIVDKKGLMLFKKSPVNLSQKCRQHIKDKIIIISKEKISVSEIRYCQNFWFRSIINHNNDNGNKLSANKKVSIIEMPVFKF